MNKILKVRDREWNREVYDTQLSGDRERNIERKREREMVRDCHRNHIRSLGYFLAG